MSGGSFNYAYRHLDEMIEFMQHSEIAERRAFGLHLVKVQTAMRTIEWVDSGDNNKGDEIAPIREALGIDADPLIADAAMLALSREIERARRVLVQLNPLAVPDRP
jgi:hypothetical protein